MLNEVTLSKNRGLMAVSRLAATRASAFAVAIMAAGLGLGPLASAQESERSPNLLDRLRFEIVELRSELRKGLLIRCANQPKEHGRFAIKIPCHRDGRNTLVRFINMWPRVHTI